MISSIRIYLYLKLLKNHSLNKSETKKLLDKQTLDVLLNRLSCELIENHFDFRNSILIGLQPRGIFLF